MLLILAHEQARANELQDIGHLVGRARRVDAARHCADAHRRLIGKQVLDADVAHDRDAGAGLEPAREQPRRRDLHLVSVLLPCQLPEHAAALVPESDTGGVLTRPLGQQPRQRAGSQPLQGRAQITCWSAGQVHKGAPGVRTIVAPWGLKYMMYNSLARGSRRVRIQRPGRHRSRARPAPGSHDPDPLLGLAGKRQSRGLLRRRVSGAAPRRAPRGAGRLLRRRPRRADAVPIG